MLKRLSRLSRPDYIALGLGALVVIGVALTAEAALQQQPSLPSGGPLESARALMTQLESTPGIDPLAAATQMDTAADYFDTLHTAEADQASKELRAESLKLKRKAGEKPVPKPSDGGGGGNLLDRFLTLYHQGEDPSKVDAQTLDQMDNLASELAANPLYAPQAEKLTQIASELRKMKGIPRPLGMVL